jgi:putative flippase GtrA
VTCPSLLRRGRLAGEAGARTADLPGTGLHRVGDALVQALVQARHHLRGNDTFGQFGRFVLVGGLSTLLYGLVFIAADGLGDQIANLIGAVLSTLLANELHRRLTFRAGGQVSWFTAQWEGGGLAVVGLVTTSMALAGFRALFGDVPALAQISLVTAVTAVIGAMRFVALRAWVFSTGSAPRD